MSDNVTDTDRPEAAAPDLGSAVAALHQPGKTVAEIEAGILDLIASFAKSDRQALIDELAKLPLEMFGTMKTIRATLAVAERGKRVDELVRKFRGFMREGAPIPRWGCEDRLKSFKSRLSYDVVDFLTLLKYSHSPDRFDDIQSAIAFYTSRFDLSETMIDTLYEHTEDRSMDRETYAMKIREGFLAEHIMNDLCRRRGNNDDDLPRIPAEYRDIWTSDLSRDPTRTVDGTRKTAIFLTCHSGMMDHVKYWYKTVFEDGVRLGSGVSEKIVSSRDNPNAALLEAYRSAMKGKPVLIAADSPMGTAKNMLTVFGREVPVADGFVFLSFESKADVFWAMVVLEGGRLVLKTVQGPSREEGEKIAAYRPRLLRFVEQQLEAYFTGPPELIGVRMKWVNILSGSGGADTADAEG